MECQRDLVQARNNVYFRQPGVSPLDLAISPPFLLGLISIRLAIKPEHGINNDFALRFRHDNQPALLLSLTANEGKRCCRNHAPVFKRQSGLHLESPRLPSYVPLAAGAKTLSPDAIGSSRISTSTGPATWVACAERDADISHCDCL